MGTHKCSDATSSLLTLSLLLLWYKCAGKGGGGAHEACQPGRDVADLVHAQSGQHQCHTATCRQEPESLLRGSHLFVDHAIYADSPTQQHICLLHVRCFKGNRHACCIAEKPVPLVIRILGLAPQMYHLQTHTLFSNCIAPPNALHCALYPAQPSKTVLHCSCNAMQCNAMHCNALQCNALQCDALMRSCMLSQCSSPAATYHALSKQCAGLTSPGCTLAPWCFSPATFMLIDAHGTKSS